MPRPLQLPIACSSLLSSAASTAMRRTMIAAGNASVRWFFGSQPLMSPSSGPTPGRSSRGEAAQGPSVTKCQSDGIRTRLSPPACLRCQAATRAHKLANWAAAAGLSQLPRRAFHCHRDSRNMRLLKRGSSANDGYRAFDHVMCHSRRRSYQPSAGRRALAVHGYRRQHGRSASIRADLSRTARRAPILAAAAASDSFVLTNT